MVDKYGVLDTSRLWREVVDEVGAGYAGVAVDYMLVDNAAMQLVRDPGRFDVLLTENTFGDILSDVAAVATGGVGLAPSASSARRAPGSSSRSTARRPTSRAGASRTPRRCCARPCSMLEHGLGCGAEARLLDGAVDAALREAPTPDLGGTATTAEFGDAVIGFLGAPLEPAR